MITEIKINNFKSVQDLTLPLGRFNVLIGANGSGKSNILEAIAFGGAASADKLDNEFLGSRGIRTSSPQLMKSAFSANGYMQPIKLSFAFENNDISFSIDADEKVIVKWTISEKEKMAQSLSEFLNLISDLNQNDNPIVTRIDPNVKIEDFPQLKSTYDLWGKFIKRTAKENKISTSSAETIIREQLIRDKYLKENSNQKLSKYLIYSPEISSLRKFEDESQIKPLGIKGEGLFNVLQIFYENENYGEATISELRKYLHIIEWFDDFEAVFDKVSGRSSLVVKDRNLPDVTLNQHNVNEGFLFLLFYISLIISKETPAFFAIDNIEASFHPKLCEELIKNMVQLAKKHNKQIILTTHNPFVLDGLDLNDPEQKLFVVRRNADGETIADLIDKPVKNVKLSEAWMRGRIGGNPETI